MQAAIFFDTADIYGSDSDEPFGASKALLGRVFAESANAGKVAFTRAEGYAVRSQLVFRRFATMTGYRHAPECDLFADLSEEKAINSYRDRNPAINPRPIP